MHLNYIDLSKICQRNELGLVSKSGSVVLEGWIGGCKSSYMNCLQVVSGRLSGVAGTQVISSDFHQKLLK